MDIKDWILIGGGILLVAVIVHGFWVAWRNRRDTLKMAIDQNIPRDEVDEWDLVKGELPNGGARSRGESPPTREDPSVAPLSRQTPLFGEAVDGDAPIVAEPAAARPKTGPSGRNRNAERPERAVEKRAAPKSSRKKEQALEKPVAEPQEIIVISVLARDGASFQGNDLTQIFMKNGLKYGDMNIFHRLDVTTRATQFSIVSMLEPGTFDLSNMNEFETPGISFFLQLPGPDAPLVVFEDMLEVARNVAAALNGDLKDEHKSAMTAQTIEHLKQRITDFSRKHLSQRA